MSTLCVGIDPAPSGRGSAVVEVEVGNPKSRPLWRENVSHSTLRADLRRWKAEYKSVLIAWDAPLTGPHNPDSTDAGMPARDFTMRPIEKELGIHNLPKGISVQGYAGCQHWTITRNLLGLPRVGPFDQEWGKLPYQLLCSPPDAWTGHHVVEVHPAVAIWEWLRRADAKIQDWRYKSETRQRQREICAQFLDGLERQWCQSPLRPLVELIREHREDFTESTDLLDAVVAAALAMLLVSSSDQVEIRGNRSQGAMLLPSLIKPQKG